MLLNLKTLSERPADVRGPSYHRGSLSAGIVHIGLGNFHRAHQAWYLHRLMEQGDAFDWAIVGASVRDGDLPIREKLLEQDCLTTLIELDPSGQSAEITGSMIDYVPIEDKNRALIAQMSDPQIRIVSMTVTEGGYYQRADGQFDASHDDILHDAAHPDAPNTAFGAIVAALRIRRDASTGPFTCQSCDNLQGNGDILRQTVVGLAKLSNPELAMWIADTVTFPNSMVDCIVPATGSTELAMARDYGIQDAVPVTHENFRQWVIEDKFCAGRPAWEKVGATLTDDVDAFEAQKLRLLNAGHQIIATAGEMLSIETISGTMEHPLISALFRKIEVDEIVPHVAAVPDMTPLAYVDLVERRFSNAQIVDTTRRVAFDGSSRHSGFLHPILRDALNTETSIEGLTLVEALWARMCAGTREDGSDIEPNDPFWGDLTVAAKTAKDTPMTWISNTQFYGDLGADPRFAECFSRWLRLIWDQGTEAAIQTYLES